MFSFSIGPSWYYVFGAGAGRTLEKCNRHKISTADHASREFPLSLAIKQMDIYSMNYNIILNNPNINYKYQVRFHTNISIGNPIISVVMRFSARVGIDFLPNQAKFLCEFHFGLRNTLCRFPKIFTTYFLAMVHRIWINGSAFNIVSRRLFYMCVLHSVVCAICQPI